MLIHLRMHTLYMWDYDYIYIYFFMVHWNQRSQIPVDMVANAMVTAAAIHASKSGSQTVYHVGSSCKNPITFGLLHDLAARYFTKSPLVGRDDSPIIVSKGTILTTMAQFSFYMTMRYKLPLQVSILFFLFP